MDSVQRLRLLAQQTGALQSTPQQTVTTETKPAPAKTATGQTTSTTTTSSPTVIKIESADPQVVYVPTYNPNTVYGTWPNTAYPPVYLPPSPGEQFTDSLVKGLGFSLGVATTYAIFSNIDWDDDDDWDHHHDDDWDHHGGYNRNGDNNININVENFNKISGQRLTDANRTWQHNPAYREGVPYPTNTLNNRFHSTNTATGLSATQQKPVNRDSQRQAALSQMEKSTGKTFPQTARPGTKDAQRQASTAQLKQISQRNNYRGYDTKPQTAQRTAAKTRDSRPTTTQRQEKRVSQPARSSQPRANALSGNDSRSANWQASSSEAPRAGNRLPAISNRARRLPGVLNTVNSVTVKEADMKSKLLSGIALFMLSAAAMAQQSFSTPDQATDALASAISEQNESAMNTLLGENWRDFLPPEGVDPDAVDRFLRDWKVRHNTVVDGNKAHLVVGDSDWQLPIPVIKTASGWQLISKKGRKRS